MRRYTPHPPRGQTPLSKRPHNQGSTYTADAKARIERTRREGRYQQALELVKQLYKYEPTPDHLELLKDTYVQRALQLHGMGAVRDAATVLEVASRLDEKNRAWLERLAKEMARCGDAVRLKMLMDRLAHLPGGAETSDIGKQLLTSVADAAILQEGAGKNAVPPELKEDHDRIVQAFREVENGQDDAARQTLAAVGLKSPFLEWKILLRGLQAYYANDDERARENWQRLDPERPPARIAAPFRAAIDPAYQAAQSPPVQVKLRHQFESTQGGDLNVQLRALRKALARPDTLSEALALCERLIPALQQQAPQVVPRLAASLYWKVLETGPNDLARYRRVFGGPPTDPKFDRLNALGNELAGNLDKAHKHWEAYQKDIAERPDVWPGEEGPLARALVYIKMAENAASVPTPEQFAKLPRAIRQMERPPRPLQPTAEQCYRKAIELAPSLIEAHTGLFRATLQTGKEAKVIETGEALLEKFPHDVETARMLGTFLLQRERNERACEVWEKVVHMQPMDASARQFLGAASRGLARELVLKKQYDEARRRYQASLDLVGPDLRPGVLCNWSVAERVAGDPARADELLTQARALVGELYISYLQLVESHRMRLPPKEKSRLAKEFTAKLDDPVDAATLVSLVEYAASLVVRGVTYFGIKTHVKKIVGLASKLDARILDERLLQRLVKALLEHEGVGRILPPLYRTGQARFPNNPHFPYFEAVHLMGDDPDESLRDYKVRGPLEHAERLARQRPADEPGIKEMLADIERRLAVLRVLNPFADLFSRMGDDFGPDFMDDF
jgi:tetratricopeptide (TPR) repeat protein